MVVGRGAAAWRKRVSAANVRLVWLRMLLVLLSLLQLLHWLVRRLGRIVLLVRL